MRLLRIPLGDDFIPLTIFAGGEILTGKAILRGDGVVGIDISEEVHRKMGALREFTYLIDDKAVYLISKKSRRPWEIPG